MPKLCTFENCRKEASYGYSRSNRERCRLHKEDRKLCSQLCACGKSRPVFNNPGETKALYCSACSKDGMVDVKNPKCIECKVKQPAFNNPGETKALYCSACSKDGMVDVKHPKCIECKVKHSLFNNPGETKALYCSACSKDGMVDIKNPKCIECKVKQPVFNSPGETKALYCSACSKDGMVDIKNPKCIECKVKVPNFNNPGETKALYCSACSKDGMVDIKNPKCIECKVKQPVFNSPGETKALYCSACSKDGMVDVKNSRCKGQAGHCPQAGNKKYKGYCTHCFSHMFPKDPLTFQIRCKTKEIAVRDFINTHFEGFHHDRPIRYGCDCAHRRKIDHRKLIGNTMLAIETDEDQHRYYDTEDETKRYDDLFMAYFRQVDIYSIQSRQIHRQEWKVCESDDLNEA